MAWPNRKWGHELLLLVVVVLGLLAMVQPSMQLSLKNHLHSIIQQINSEGPYLGLVLEYETNEFVLLRSNLFIPSNHTPSLKLSGRTFHIGKIEDADIIYVLTGDATANAAATVQLLISTFSIDGIVHYGTAGAVDDTLLVGDVVVPKQVAFTGHWNWKNFESKKGQLRFGDFNYPGKGDNLLGSIDFEPSTLYTSEQEQTMFWLPINTSWLVVATQLQDVELQQCLENKCLPRTPILAYGLRASTADMFISNVAYREYLYKKLKVSIVDEETASVVLVALSNEVPVIVFRGVSNMAGGSTGYDSYSYLGSVNAFNAAVSFICAVSGTTNFRANY
ncbi:bark storage protein A-like [Ricinus communis]|uniref:bark storage protein A-like n=1 Tax=Ricinus communis TaxID=3988 RepID=UPI00201AD23F|nr:bark storage protein A-like [Ricinus communis]